MQQWLAIDIGGTKVAGALVYENGDVRFTRSEATESTGNKQMAAQLQRIAREVCAEANVDVKELDGIGVVVPGGVDREKGIALGGVNLGIRDLPVADIFSELTDAPVALENDTNAGALGEKWFGGGRGVQDFAYMAVGTGVGGGLILNGQLYLGSTGAAGEVGHCIVDPNGLRCRCGTIGCLEGMTSGVGMPQLALSLLGEEQARLMGKGELPSSPVIYAAAAAGDEGAAKVIAEVGRLLAVSVVGLFRLLDVEKVIVGGGVANEGQVFLDAIYEGVAALGYKHLRAGSVILSPLGSAANLLGAAAVVREKAP